MKVGELFNLLQAVPLDSEVVITGANDNPVEDYMDIGDVLHINVLTEDCASRVVLRTN